MMLKLVRRLLALGALLISSQGMADTVGSVGIPNTSGGVVISCSNPNKVLSVVRTDEATHVIQTGPQGVSWRADLPPMQAEYDQYWLSRDGSAAVIVTSHDTGDAFLVSGHYKPIDIIPGFVAAVDYQQDRVLIATINDDGLRVRVYNVRSGALVGDNFSDDVIQVNADLPFYVRLAGDGQSYYYVQQSVAGGPGGPVLRDVVTGQKYMPKITLDDGSSVTGSIFDMRMYSAERGYLALNGGIYAFSNRGLIPIPVNKAVGSIYEITESTDATRQPVEGPRGWGVFDTRDGRWIIAEHGIGVDLYPSAAGLIAINGHKDRPGIMVYDISGPQAKVTRRFPGPLTGYEFRRCANAYGFMTYQNGKFNWHRTVKQP